MQLPEETYHWTGDSQTEFKIAIWLQSEVKNLEIMAK